MAQEVLRKKPTKGPHRTISTARKHNEADISAAINGHVGGVHVYLRSTDSNVKIKINYNTGGLEDTEYESRGITVADVERLYSQLNHHFQNLKQYGDSENLRKTIAQESWYLYDKLIPDEDKIKILELHSQYLTEQSTLEEGAILRPQKILVKANGVTIPWELLYIENPWDHEKGEAFYDERYFLGYWAFIQQDITPHSRNYPDVREFTDSGAKVFFDNNLEVARDQEAPGIVTMFNAVGLNSHFADKLETSANNAAFFDELTRRSGCIVHMACHSSNPSNSGSEGFIRINENYILDESSVRLNQFTVAGKPILFLNSCDLALVHPGRYCQFLNYFFERGFGAIIATEIEITDNAAWDFAKLVYSGFLHKEGSAFDVAIFNARRAFLSEYESLIGFTYSYYGLGNRLRPIAGKEAA